MNIDTAMKERHMVRKYVDKPISTELVDKLNQRISDDNSIHNLSIKLMVNNTNAVGAIVKLILAKGVKNYAILAGEESKDLDERLGYSGADVMIHAQTLGLNTWW